MLYRYYDVAADPDRPIHRGSQRNRGCPDRVCWATGRYRVCLRGCSRQRQIPIGEGWAVTIDSSSRNATLKKSRWIEQGSPVRPFRAGESTYDKSIALDASTIGDITVTVAVRADRSEELAILDSIYTAADGYPFFPFRNKAHDLDYTSSTDFFEEVVDANIDRLDSTVHLGRDGSGPERVEAVQSAVLEKELDPSDTLVILDGNEEKAKRFGRAVAGISDEVPPVATCIQSEFYYPSSLLADLCASHLAYEIDHPRHCSEVTPKTPITKEDFSHYWGKAYHSMLKSSDPAQITPITQRRGDTVRTRVNCWFEGYMGGGEPYPTDHSVQATVRYAERQGYDELAARLSEI